VWFRPHNRDPRLQRLYLVGAGTHPGAGVPGVISSAKATARVVLGDLVTRFGWELDSLEVAAAIP
jgi:phytoene desaturase